MTDRQSFGQEVPETMGEREGEKEGGEGERCVRREAEQKFPHTERAHGLLCLLLSRVFISLSLSLSLFILYSSSFSSSSACSLSLSLSLALIVIVSDNALMPDYDK